MCDIATHWKFHLLGNNNFVIMSLTVNIALPVLGYCDIFTLSCFVMFLLEFISYMHSGQTRLHCNQGTSVHVQERKAVAQSTAY